MTVNQSWPWPQEMDPLLAVPASHRIIPGNDQARVPAVVIEPGAREPGRTHQPPAS